MAYTLRSQSFAALGGLNTIQSYTESAVQAEALFAAIEAEVRRIEAKYSRYDPDSILSQINAAAGERAVTIDEETEKLLEYAALAYEQSDGLFDISSGVLRKVWRFESGLLPKQENVLALLDLIGFERIERAPGTVFLPVAGMEIDFGGFGKEYAVDRAVQLCLLHGCEHSLLSFAGDVRAAGPQADASPWSIGIAHPREPERVCKVLALEEGALASSGDYERFMEVEGRRYSHLLCPKSGWPIEGSLQSASVFAQSCLLAGTMASIAMLQAADAGLEQLKQSGLSYFAIDDRGREHTATPGV